MPVRAPEPWREPPSAYERYEQWQRRPRVRRSRDPLTGQAEVGDTELSWGEGLVAPHANGLPPSMGGQYMPKAPAVEPLPGSGGVGPPRQRWRPRSEARGYPGEPMGG
ncbi:hypothetical protein MSP7336_03355 [Mycobacterium shimoidei]|uniref:Uncharacterized protein n=1 Tax=Mycobacterium shimoidei TaxID=29313 RepID=A0A375Z1P1_MYCSH|nr:hypothetical protein [Mycobacterium shimoidei]SRX95091.1 hypothetical protein MSP7336_03355 [Mycobacterium shimoidei]